MNLKLNGSCQVPITAHAVLKNDQLELRGLVGDAKGEQILRGFAKGDADQAEQIGIEVAEQLLAQGAAEILAKVHEQDA